MKYNKSEVCIIILNWRAALDTCQCIDSVIENLESGWRLIVVDNDSCDGSGDEISAYMNEKFGGHREIKCCDINEVDTYEENAYPVLLLSDKNGGYAAGNNLGINLAIRFGCEFFWILNNDSCVIENCLKEMKAIFSQGNVGFVGSVIQKSNGCLECYGGGRFYPWLGRAKLAATKSKFMPSDTKTFLSGASLMFSRDLIDRVGLMDERYFMYWEEVDWQVRAKAAGLLMRVHEGSRIVHKSAGRERGMAFYYYRSRSAVMFTGKFYGMIPSFSALLFVVISEAIQNIVRPKYVYWSLKGGISGFLNPIRRESFEEL